MSSEDNLSLSEKVNNTNNASTAFLSAVTPTSPPLTVTIDAPSILQSIEMLNIRVHIRNKEDLDLSFMQDVTRIPVKSLSIPSSSRLFDGKSDYSIFLKYDPHSYNDQAAYTNFIPSLQVLICPLTSSKVKEVIKEWDASGSDAPPVRKLIFMESELGLTHPNVLFVNNNATNVTSVMEKCIQECLVDVVSYLETKMSEIENMEVIESPKAMDDNLPKQVRHRLKSRVKGRSFKLLADINLLFGLYQESLSLYNKAIEDCKLNSDIIWQVAAQEGHAVASFVKSVFSEEARKAKYVKQAAEGLSSKLHDLSSGYEKAALPFLAFRTILQASRVYQALGMVTEYHAFLSSTCQLLPSMPREEFEYALSLIMRCYEQSGLRRKRAILAHQLAHHFYSNRQVALAVSVVESCCFPQMRILPVREVTNWNRLAYQLTRTVLEMVKSATQDRSLQLLYSLLHLKYGRQFLGEKQQKELFGMAESLSKDLPMLEVRSVTPLCCPRVVRTAQITSGLTFITPHRTNAFINDIRRVETKGKGVILVNQVFTVTVELQNSFSCDLQIKNFTLETNNGVDEFICESQSFELGYASRHTVTLNASVTTGGLETLQITGVSYTLFNVPFEETVEMSMIKILPEQPFIKIIGCLSSLSLIEGERTTLNFSLMNTSQKRVQRLSLTTKPTTIHVGGERSLNSLLYRRQEDPVVSIQTEVTTLEAGEQCQVIVQLVGVLGLTALEILVEYEGEEPSIPRSACHSVIVNVRETFSVEDVLLLPMDPFGKYEGPVLSFSLSTHSFDPIHLSIYNHSRTSHNESFVISGGDYFVKKIICPIQRLVHQTSFLEAVRELQLDERKQAMLNKLVNNSNNNLLETFWVTHQILSQFQITWRIPEQGRSGIFDIEEWQIPNHHLPLIYLSLFSLEAQIMQKELNVLVKDGRALVRVQAYDQNGVSLNSSAEDTVYQELQDENKVFILPEKYDHVLICATCPITRRNEFIQLKQSS